jgi:hypothetical protein
MSTYSDSDTTNYNLNFYVSDGIFACRVQRTLSTKHPEFALSVAVVDTRSLAGARNHCEGSAIYRYTKFQSSVEISHPKHQASPHVGHAVSIHGNHAVRNHVIPMFTIRQNMVVVLNQDVPSLDSRLPQKTFIWPT